MNCEIKCNWGSGGKALGTFTIFNLKLVSAIFYQFSFLHQMIALWKLWKMLFISSEKLFSFSRYSNFHISLLPSFSSCQPLLKRWSKINLKVYYIINCLIKNLIRDFAWYHQKEKNYDIQTSSIDRVLNKEHFSWKIMQKIKASPGLLFNFDNNLK